MKEEFGHYQLPEELAIQRESEGQRSTATAYAELEAACGETLDPPAEQRLRAAVVEDWKRFGSGVLNAIREKFDFSK